MKALSFTNSEAAEYVTLLGLASTTYHKTPVGARFAALADRLRDSQTKHVAITSDQAQTVLELVTEALESAWANARDAEYNMPDKPDMAASYRTIASDLQIILTTIGCYYS